MVLRPLLLFTASPATLWPHVCALSHFSHVLLFVTPYTAVLQAPLSMGILQARILEWVVMPSSEDLPDPGIKPIVSCIGRRILYHWVTWEALQSPRESHGQISLTGYSPRGGKESDTTEWLNDSKTFCVYIHACASTWFAPTCIRTHHQSLWSAQACLVWLCFAVSHFAEIMFFTNQRCVATLHWASWLVPFFPTAFAHFLSVYHTLVILTSLYKLFHYH